jgi:hypothetical protein
MLIPRWGISMATWGTMAQRWRAPIAAVHGVDFLLTWNCGHIANAVIAKGVANLCRQYDWDPPVICTPEELF